MATSFRFRAGSYFTAAGTARPAGLNVTPQEINTYQTSHLYSLQCEVWISTSGTSNFVSAMQGLRNALSTPRQDVGIEYSDDGVNWFPTMHFLSATGAQNGPNCRIMQFNAGPLQYATEQWVMITAEAEYVNGGETATTIVWDEAVEIIGEGGAKTILRPRHTSVDLQQQLKAYTNVTVVQSGTISGKSGYIALPSPLIATAGARQVDISRDRKSIVRRGLFRTEYRRDYAYTFLLNASPGTVNPGGL